MGIFSIAIACIHNLIICINSSQPMRGIDAKRACAKMTQSKKLMTGEAVMIHFFLPSQTLTPHILPGDRNSDIEEDCLDVKGALRVILEPCHLLFMMSANPFFIYVAMNCH